MTKEQQNVKDFMVLASQNTPDKPTMPDEATRKLRVRLQLEETLELAKAMGVTIIDRNSDLPINDVNSLYLSADDEKFDFVETCDALGDSLYILLGSAVAAGIDLEPFFNAIHDSNLKKFGPGGYRREDGKWMKPKDWQKPDLESILENQQKLGEYGYLIGLSIEEARAARIEGHTFRTVNVNGKSMVVTCDYNPYRANVAVVDGKITKILYFG